MCYDLHAFTGTNSTGTGYLPVQASCRESLAPGGCVQYEIWDAAAAISPTKHNGHAILDDSIN